MAGVLDRVPPVTDEERARYADIDFDVSSFAQGDAGLASLDQLSAGAKASKAELLQYYNELKVFG